MPTMLLKLSKCWLKNGVHPTGSERQLAWSAEVHSVAWYSALRLPLVALWQDCMFSLGVGCHLCWRAVWFLASPRTVLTPAGPCGDLQAVSRDNKDTLHTGWHHGNSSQIPTNQNLAGSCQPFWEPEGKLTPSLGRTPTGPGLKGCWGFYLLRLFCMLTLCVNIRSFASSWTAGFHGEKLGKTTQKKTDHHTNTFFLTISLVSYCHHTYVYRVMHFQCSVVSVM